MKKIFSLLLSIAAAILVFPSCKVISPVKDPISWTPKANRFKEKDPSFLTFVAQFTAQKDRGCMSTDSTYYRKTGTAYAIAEYSKTREAWMIKKGEVPPTKNAAFF